MLIAYFLELKMNDQYQTIDYPYATLDAQGRNRVMRNTYWLLAISMIPTVLGAWLGIATGITYACLLYTSDAADE